MKLTELVQILRATGYPVAFSHFREPTPLPYITYFTPTTNNFVADDEVYTSVQNFDVELYTDTKNPQAEKKIESVLKANGLPFDAYDVWIEDEEMLKRTYEIGVILDG